MISKNQIREKVLGEKFLFSSMISMLRKLLWLTLLKDLSLDFITIDKENSPYNWGEGADLEIMAAGVGLPTVVRIPRPAWHYITNVFDAGAYGVLAPYCETVDEVKEVVRATRWRPLKGKFVEGVMNENAYPGESTKAYLQELNRDNVVIIGIGSISVVENQKFGGIVAVFVGSADLSISLGIPRQFYHSEFVRTVRRIIKIAQQYEVQVAANFQPLTQSIKWAKEGMTLIIHSQDYKIFGDAYADVLQQLAQATGKQLEKGAEPEIEI